MAEYGGGERTMLKKVIEPDVHIPLGFDTLYIIIEGLDEAWKQETLYSRKTKILNYLKQFLPEEENG